DGDPDLYLLNGAATPGSNLQTTPLNALYENRAGRFVDVTKKAGVGDSGYGMGMCVGDYDSDGRIDFLVTNFGPDRLYRNLGEGRFEERAEAAGVADSRWSTGCAFGDLDGDGDLDLYVAHYVDFSFNRYRACGDQLQQIEGYCQPLAFAGQVDALYINQGDGRFREQGKARGIAQTNGDRGFGVILSDIDNDSDLDIYVANDGTENRLYLNQGAGVFEDASLLSGAALNMAGQAEAGMGVDLGDVDGDGLMDIIVTHYAMETNTLYKNLGGAFFEDSTHRFALTKPSYLTVGWGVQFLDYDNDADLDIAVANGHVQEHIAEIEPRLRYPQRNQLFENQANKIFREVTEQAGATWATAKVSRGLAVADWNNDGRLDLMITNTNDKIDLLENRRSDDNHWLGIVLQGPAANRFAIGAQVTLRAGQRKQVREVRSGGSFLAQPDLRLHFGLARYHGPVEVEIRWPDGHRQITKTDELDRYWLIRYGNQPH
ncbi:MAG: CRTAC1 family protein, partial [Candidatus Competibacteraceae bacterium]|nr:CRTAC1 family protein [Candidatus Competibacteraceae bacterium]